MQSVSLSLKSDPQPHLHWKLDFPSDWKLQYLLIKKESIQWATVSILWIISGRRDVLIICRDREFAQSTVAYSSIADESISTVRVWNSIHHYLCCCVSFHQSGFIFWKIKVKVDGLHSETQHRSRADWLAARVKVIHSWFRCSIQLFSYLIFAILNETIAIPEEFSIPFIKQNQQSAHQLIELFWKRFSGNF